MPLPPDRPRMKSIRLVTDGACIPNPGPGGWAYILRYRDNCRELYGHEAQTTNNRMELQAAVSGLSALKQPCQVEVKTDSEYLKRGVTEWLPRWKQNGWRTTGKHPVKNQDLWHELDRQLARHKTTWTWTRGHADDADNNRCDELANRAAQEQISSA